MVTGLFFAHFKILLQPEELAVFAALVEEARKQRRVGAG